MSSERLRVGDSREMLVVRDLNRTQIAQYAGASGDYNPLHVDDPYAVRRTAFGGVIAHGMLTMGLAGKVVSTWFGADNIASYGARFRAPVKPGDTLIVRATIESIEPALVRLQIVASNQRGETVLTGEAGVRRAPTTLGSGDA